jgi:DNA-binding NtrC family response regulator
VEANLPGRSGLDVCADIMERFPSAKVIIMAGGPFDFSSSRALVGKDWVNFLQKPFALAELNRILEDTMRS